MPRTHSLIDLADHVSCVSKASPKHAGKSAPSPGACWDRDRTLLAERQSPRRPRSRRQRCMLLTWKLSETYDLTDHVCVDRQKKYWRQQEELQNQKMIALASPSNAARPTKVANEGELSCEEQTGASPSPSQSNRPPTKDKLESHDGRATDLRASLPSDSARNEGVPHPPAASSFCPPFASAKPDGLSGHGLLQGPYSANNRYNGPTVYSSYSCHIPPMPARLTTQKAPPAASSSDSPNAMVHSTRASGTEVADVPLNTGLQPLLGPAIFAPTGPLLWIMTMVLMRSRLRMIPVPLGYRLPQYRLIA
ncbi:hypothetical protein CBS147347_11472 [Aspergillus niger]|nr:hypothetical protein CBS147347_11472 [Aspergillus niger]